MQPLLPIRSCFRFCLLGCWACLFCCFGGIGSPCHWLWGRPWRAHPATKTTCTRYTRSTPTLGDVWWEVSASPQAQHRLLTKIAAKVAFPISAPGCLGGAPGSKSVGRFPRPACGTQYVHFPWWSSGLDPSWFAFCSGAAGCAIFKQLQGCWQTRLAEWTSSIGHMV